MLCPSLLFWVIECHNLLGKGISGVCEWTFEFVATIARLAQIVFVIAAVFRDAQF